MTGATVPPEAPQAVDTKATAKKGNSRFRSTWHEDSSRPTWGWGHWLFHILDADPLPPNFKAPVHEFTDEMPYVSELDLHRWILPRALPPLLLHYALHSYGYSLPPLAAFVLYTAWFKAFGIMTIRLLTKISANVGFLDGKVPRDGVPDDSVGKVMTSLISTSTYRPMLATMLAYNREERPNLTFPWIFIYVGLYAVLVDFYFYWYHRAMHEVPFLWKFHRTHHLTRHPNPALTLFADEVQEAFDIVVIPLCAYLTMRTFTSFNFYDWFLSGLYVTFVELSGHCGMRALATSPTTLGILPWLNLSIIIEG